MSFGHRTHCPCHVCVEERVDALRAFDREHDRYRNWSLKPKKVLDKPLTEEHN